MTKEQFASVTKGMILRNVPGQVLLVEQSYDPIMKRIRVRPQVSWGQKPARWVQLRSAEHMTLMSEGK